MKRALLVLAFSATFSGWALAEDSAIAALNLSAPDYRAEIPLPKAKALPTYPRLEGAHYWTAAPFYQTELKKVREWVTVNINRYIEKIERDSPRDPEKWLPLLYELKEFSETNYPVEVVSARECSSNRKAFAFLKGSQNYDGRIYLCKDYFDRVPAESIQNIIHEMTHLLFHSYSKYINNQGYCECQATLVEYAVMVNSGWVPGTDSAYLRMCDWSHTTAFVIN
jgi:hypothetical protein